MDKYLVAIGGGEIKNKTTLKIDEFVSELVKGKAGDRRANMVFFGTASHDSMPYFNSFRKTYTSVFDIKAEVALSVYGEMSKDKIFGKIDAADGVYVGGGDTVYMLEKWKETGIDEKLIKAYGEGKIVCGLSAGAICWFENMYSDYEIMRGESGEYKMHKGLGLIRGTACPHFDEREKDFFDACLKENVKTAYCIENDAAVVFKNGEYYKTVSAGGKAYFAENVGGKMVKRELL